MSVFPVLKQKIPGKLEWMVPYEQYAQVGPPDLCLIKALMVSVLIMGP